MQRCIRRCRLHNGCSMPERERHVKDRSVQLACSAVCHLCLSHDVSLLSPTPLPTACLLFLKIACDCYCGYCKGVLGLMASLTGLLTKHHGIAQARTQQTAARGREFLPSCQHWSLLCGQDLSNWNAPNVDTLQPSKHRKRSCFMPLVAATSALWSCSQHRHFKFAVDQ